VSVIESIERHYKEVTKQMIGLKNKLEEIEAFEKNYERNSLFELETITQQNKRKIQQELLNIWMVESSNTKKSTKFLLTCVQRTRKN